MVSKANENELPKGHKILQKVDGGGNSLFKSILLYMEDDKDINPREIPANFEELREQLVQYIIDHPTKFNVKLNKENKGKFNAMKAGHLLPSEEVLLACCEIFQVELRIHCGMQSPLVYKTNKN